MENNEQKQPQQDQAKNTSNTPAKPQRKLKFKTLDGKMVNLECDYDIKIIDLKKKLAEIYKIEPIRQRLLNKGKQFKDDETLDKLVEKDDTIIHLVFRSESDVKAAQENETEPNTQISTEAPTNAEVSTEIITEVNTEIVTEMETVVETEPKPERDDRIHHGQRRRNEFVGDDNIEIPTVIEEIEEVENPYYENEIKRPTPEIINISSETNSPEDTSFKTMGIASGVGVALGAAALGTYAIIKSKDKEAEEEEDMGYEK